MSYTDSFKRTSPNDSYSTFIVKCVEQNLSEVNFSDVKSPDVEVLQHQKQLVQATFASDVTLIKELLNSGVSVEITEYNERFYYGSKYYLTPLQIATVRGDQKTLGCLIDHGANVNCKDRYQVTPTHMAAEQGHYECLRMLLEAGAKCCPLSYCHRTYFNPAPFYIGTTPLHIAVSNKHVLCIKELLCYSADYNVADELGRTSLYIACELGAEECVLTLLRNTSGHDILSMPGFETGDTPLHFAIRYGMLHSIKELLQLGSDVHYNNINGLSPMDICLKYLYSNPELFIKILKLLVLYGYNTNVNWLDGGRQTLLQQVICSDIDKCPEVAKFLIAYGANTNIKIKNNMDLLQCEFKKFEADPSVLRAILDSMRFPPKMDCLFSTFRNQKQSVSTADSGNFRRIRISRNQMQKRLMLKWYEISYPCLPSLQHLCRFTIREAVGSVRLNRVKDFPVPKKCISYILLGIKV